MRTKEWFNSLLTEEDDRTPNVAIVAWAVGTFFFIVFAGYSVWHTGKFDMQSYGIGFGALMTAGGGSLWMKQRSGA